MGRKKVPQPTDGELEILRVLWSDGPSTVRHVHERLQRSRGTGYTTVLKLMQIMADKGLVRRDESRRTHIYAPAASEEATQTRLVRDLIDKAFSGSASQLVMRALAARPASDGELSEIRKMLRNAAKGKS